jgi:metallophosphoesterase (TIGR03767 family)
VPLTHLRRLGAGHVLNAGARLPYRAVVTQPGERHVVRSELAGSSVATVSVERPIACLAHMTDLHVTDVQSPARFEFLNREFSDPRFVKLVPVQRPQEALTPHALSALIRALNTGMGGPLTHAQLELVLTGGDAIDNAQQNEIRAFTQLLDGGHVRLNSGSSAYEGVQSAAWPDDIFWNPDGGLGEPDLFRRDCGFPLLPGLLDRALRPIDAPGLRVPWLGCHGNHETLCQGVGVVTLALAAAFVGGEKPIELPPAIDRDTAHETFVTRPEAFLASPTRAVTPDPERRYCSLEDFVSAHIVPGMPARHGFNDRNRSGRIAYYAHDTPSVRFIVLDTACLAGSAEGCIGEEQLRWLEKRLIEVHSSYRANDGRTIDAGNGDRLVVIVSHHGSQVLGNNRPHADGSQYGGGPRLLPTLLRFDNVVLWLNGHTHTHRIRPRADPLGAGNGLWEVTTGSFVDWPCQARLIELFDAGDGMIAIASTLIDHDGAADPAGAETQLELAGLHRQLAGNSPWAGFDSGREGTPLDRNVIMLRHMTNGTA